MTADRWCTFHMVMVAVWLAMTIPTVLYWRDSILWVSFMSIYAIVVGHAGAWQAAHAERASE